jgi:hypothetical protein
LFSEKFANTKSPDVPGEADIAIPVTKVSVFAATFDAILLCIGR